MTNYEKRMNNAASDLNTILRECKTFKAYEYIFNWEIAENGTIEFYCNNELILQVYKLPNKNYKVVFYNDSMVENYESDNIELVAIGINSHMFYSVVNFNKVHAAMDNYYLTLSKYEQETINNYFN